MNDGWIDFSNNNLIRQLNDIDGNLKNGFIDLPDLPESKNYIRTQYSTIGDFDIIELEESNHCTIITYKLNSGISSSIINLLNKFNSLLIVFSLPDLNNKKYNTDNLARNLLMYDSIVPTSIMIANTNHIKAFAVNDQLVTGSLNFSFSSELVGRNDEVISYYKNGGHSYIKAILKFFNSTHNCNKVSISKYSRDTLSNYLQENRSNRRRVSLSSFIKILIKDLKFNPITIYEENTLLAEVNNRYSILLDALNSDSMRIKCSYLFDDFLGSLTTLINEKSCDYVSPLEIVDKAAIDSIEYNGSNDVNSDEINIEAFNNSIDNINRINIYLCKSIENDIKDYISEKYDNVFF